MQVINTPPPYEGITQYKFNIVDNNAAVNGLIILENTNNV